LGEGERAINAREQALFESYFEQERHRFVHLWADRSQNFWTKMGAWNAVRKKLREEQTNKDIEFKRPACGSKRKFAGGDLDVTR